MSQEQAIIAKVWNFAHVLRDDGVGYGDYLEQLTYLLFLKMAHERSKVPGQQALPLPPGYDWESLSNKKGAALEAHYVALLRELAKAPGTLGQIYVKAQNKIQDPAKLYKVIRMIDQENWNLLGADLKGQIYEGLLEKNAADTKSGAGQYFTPRPLIQAMVDCLQPKPGKTICDPACGTGGFFLAAYDFIAAQPLDKEQKVFLKKETFYGNEIVANTRRLCLMNMFLHNIGDVAGEPLISGADALISASSRHHDYVLANPPFGKKSSMTSTNEAGEQDKQELVYNRQDFWASTSNKQLNFMQHIRSLLKTDGEAAVVLPDNVLFEGGAGETVRRALLQNTELHTILRLPTGIFYANGVKANVLFFNNRPGAKTAWTREVWFYDYRTNVHHTLKKNPMRREDLQAFVDCYQPGSRATRRATWSEETPEGRWRSYTYEEIMARDKCNLDIFWLKDESLADLDNLPDPDILAAEIIEQLQSGLDSFKAVMDTLSGEED